MTANVATLQPLHRDHCIYTSCYCEENIYKLLQSLIRSGKSANNLFAVIIANNNETIPLWQQRSSSQEEGLVIWDYHVIALEVSQQDPVSTLVWDLDTRLPFPCSLRQYAQHALKAAFVLSSDFARWYRVIAAESFLQHFASDRSHMRAADGSWLQSPPSYPCIVAADGCTNNLSNYRDMQTGRWQQDRQPEQPKQAQQAVGAVNDGNRCVRDDLHEVNLTWDVIYEAAKGPYGVVLSEQLLLQGFLERNKQNIDP